MINIKDLIRDVPDFPKPGILFKDITPVLSSPEAFDTVTDALMGISRSLGADKVIGVESRGFILGTPVALGLGLPFVPVRKPGKLPCETVRAEYELEYGTDTLEMHTDALEAGDRVIIIDDLLATGGTAEATIKLVESQGAVVAGVLVMIELCFLNGADRIDPHNVYSLVRY